MPLDPVTIDVIANALKSLIHEMDAAIERTSMSVIIREQHDFGMSLVDRHGRMVSGTIFTGQTLAEYATTHVVEPGDVIMLNDPYLSHGEISHLADTMLAVPIFWPAEPVSDFPAVARRLRPRVSDFNAELIAWGIAWGHHMDIGADAPAGMPTQATEIFQEGLQIPPVKLYERGVLQSDLLDLVARNSRAPEMIVGDTLALSSAGKIAEKRLQELCARFGGEAVLATFDVLFDRARETMRQLIRQLPEEPVCFEDVLDNDGINDELLTLRMTLRRDGDKLSVDFTGTSPQCEGPMNLPLDPSYLKILLYDMLRLAAGDRIDVDPELDPNQGIEDLVEVQIPDQCLLSPAYPAPVSLRHLTRGRLREVIQAILAQIFPETVPATANGSLNCYSMLGVGKSPHPAVARRLRPRVSGFPAQPVSGFPAQPVSGFDHWLCFEVTAAGGGGRPFADGIDAYCFNNRLKNAPVEFVETVYPVRIEQYSLRPGSAGAGKYRGGHGLIRAIRTLRAAKLYFLDERQRTQPWGLYGGRPAAANDAYVERADGTVVMVPGKLDRFPLGPNDMFVMRTGGGGGWGDPYERDPEAVRRDVVCRLLTAAQARELYGVVLKGKHVDMAATRALRAKPVSRNDTQRVPVDRGDMQATPPPGTSWELRAPPVPWLVIGERAIAESSDPY
jgi:N-methylhydantoinase B